MPTDHRAVEVDCVIEAAHTDPEFGHLGNQHYMLYCDRGRLALQGAYGLSTAALRGRGLGLVVRRADLKYCHEVVPGDAVTVRSSFLPCERGPLLWMRHECARTAPSSSRCGPPMSSWTRTRIGQWRPSKSWSDNCGNESAALKSCTATLTGEP